MLRLRVPLSLVAVFVAIALVVGVLIGGRLIQDWNSFRNSAPAGSGDAATQIASLEARPLHLPQVPVNTPCPTGPFTNLANVRGGFAAFSALGGGPAYGLSGSGPKTDWGWYFELTFITEPQVTGWVLVRGRDAVDHTIPFVSDGPYAAGAVIGTDTIVGTPVTQRAELVLDASHHPASSGKSKWGVWIVREGIRADGWSGCAAFQLDGNGFSEVFVV